jgi:hypothetical protein
MELAYRYSGINNLQRFHRVGWQTLIIHPGYEGPGAASLLCFKVIVLGGFLVGILWGKWVGFPIWEFEVGGGRA